MGFILFTMFGVSQLLEVADAPQSETKSVTAYRFEEVKTEKFYITNEVRHKYFLRVRISYPKDAKKPITEVIAYKTENGIAYYGVWEVMPSFRKNFSQSADLPIGTVHFNLK